MYTTFTPTCIHIIIMVFNDQIYTAYISKHLFPRFSCSTLWVSSLEKSKKCQTSLYGLVSITNMLHSFKEHLWQQLNTENHDALKSKKNQSNICFEGIHIHLKNNYKKTGWQLNFHEKGECLWSPSTTTTVQLTLEQHRFWTSWVHLYMDFFQ